jgi:hypothetical protein
MAYIKISNEVENVNRLFLEKLGLSTKRDDENTIGQFGSGSKFAPIAALRNGWEWINVGTDNNGPYRMEYVSHDEDGINSIYYKYVNGDEVILKPSSFTLEAGVLSWDNNFQIFREAFSNALDENISNGVAYSIDIVDDIEHEEGIFSVYITADPALLDILNDFDRWFDINREPCFTSSEGKVYMPYDNSINIYHKGVYVYGQVSEKEEEIPLFDYSLNNIQLNEERRIRDSYYAAAEVSNIWIDAFMTTDDDSRYAEAVFLCTRVVQSSNVKRWEWSHLSPYSFSEFVSYSSGNALHKAWTNIHGNAIAVSPNEERFIMTVEAAYNRRCVIVNNEIVRKQLNLSGVDTLEDILGDELEFDFVEFAGGPKAAMLDKAKEIIQSYDYRLSTVDDIKVFAPNNVQQSLFGAARNNCIFLSTNTFTDMETLIATIVHELDHIVSGIKDDDYRAFRNLADKRIASLIMKVYGE